MADETLLLGAAANGVTAALFNRDAILADFPRRSELATLQEREYYPLSLYVELCDYLEGRLGIYAWQRVGRRMGAAVIATAFPKTIRSVEEAIAQIDAAHRLFCKPLVGAFEVTTTEPKRIQVRYTAPYNCTLQEGLFYEVALRYGASYASVRHQECRRKGADACRFEIVC